MSATLTALFKFQDRPPLLHTSHAWSDLTLFTVSSFLTPTSVRTKMVFESVNVISSANGEINNRQMINRFYLLVTRQFNTVFKEQNDK